MSLNTDSIQLSRGLSLLPIRTILALFALVWASGCSGGGSQTISYYQSSGPGVSTTSPTSLVAISNNDSITLTWKAVQGATSYNIYRLVSTPVTIATGSNIASISSGTSFTDSSVVVGTRYYYVITWVDGFGESAESAEVSAVPGPSGGTRSLTGSVFYEDREYGTTGFTGSTLTKAVRYATVEIVDSANSSILTSGTTDSRGTFNITYSTGSSTVYVRVNSEASPPASAVVEVNTMTAKLYGVVSVNFPWASSADVSMFVPITNIAGGAFNILDVLTMGYQYVNYLEGSYPSVPLTAYWSPGNLNGTYFCYGGCPAGDGIYVFNNTSNPSKPLDTDEYDDDVLWHEFGHFVAYAYSRDDSPGGSHTLEANDQDMRLSWSEGWGDFFPGAIKSWLWSNTDTKGLLSTVPGLPLSEYVDTRVGSAPFKFEFGDPIGPWYVHATSETAIAKILWDLQANFTVQPIWDVVRSYTASNPATPVNLESFWDTWYSLRSLNTASAELATVRSIYLGRSIIYDADSYEPDDAIVTASTYTVGVSSSQIRTLYSNSYPSADTDVVLFTATSGSNYTIRTSNLLNGADTKIAIYNDLDNYMSVGNDNTSNTIYAPGSTPSLYYPSLCDPYDCHENGYNILGSQVSFSPPSTGTYYVKILSSPNRPVSAGRYGSYTLTITSP